MPAPSHRALREESDSSRAGASLAFANEKGPLSGGP